MFKPIMRLPLAGSVALVSLSLLLSAPVSADVSTGVGNLTPSKPTAPLAGSVRETPTLSDFPLMFVPNQGQWDSSVSYLARTEGADVFFTPREAILRIQGESSTPAVVRLRPLDASPVTELTPGKQLHTRTSYFVGQDRARWRAKLPTHDSVRYQAIQPGVDLVFRGDGQRLVYDLELAPGADPSLIRLALDGVESLKIDPTGAMRMTLPDGTELRQETPFIYQEVAGERVAIDGGFVVLESHPDRKTHVFGFRVADHDPSLALVIDPTIDYSTIVGGKKNDTVRKVAVTSKGELIVAGSTLSLADDIFEGAYSPGGNASKTDGLLYQLNDKGDDLDFVVILGGSGDDQINSMALGNDGIYLTGWTKSTDFPTVEAIYPVPFGKSQSAFVARITTDGDEFDFATYLGGTGTDTGNAIAVDSDDENIYIAGTTTSKDLVLVNPLDNALTGKTGGFVIKMKSNPDDHWPFVFSTYFRDVDSIDAIAVLESDRDATRDIYIAGNTSSSNLETTDNAPQPQRSGSSDVFVARITAASTELAFCTYLGGSRAETLTGMTLDSDDNMILVGYTESSNFPDVNALQGKNAGGSDAFIAKLNKDANFYHFATYLGGLDDDLGLAVAVDPDDDSIYIAGETLSNQFPTENPLQSYYAGTKDGFLVKLDKQGMNVINSSYFGGTGADSITAVAVDTKNPDTVIIAGNTLSNTTDLLQFPHDNGESVNIFGDTAAQSTFAAKVGGLTENAAVPILALHFETESIIPEVAATGPLDSLGLPTLLPKLKVYLKLEGPQIVSAFKTNISYDPDEFKYLIDEDVPGNNVVPVVKWNDAILGGGYKYTIDGVGAGQTVATEGEIHLEVLIDGATLSSLPPDADGNIATITFTVNESNVDTNFLQPVPADWSGVVFTNIDILTPDSEFFSSKKVTLTQDNITAADLNARDLYVKGSSDGVIFEHHCSNLLGDCDCSGRVSIWELQYALTFTAADSASDNTGIPYCIRTYENHYLTREKTQIQDNYYAGRDNVIASPLDVATLSTFDQTFPGNSTPPALTFGIPRFSKGKIDVDLTLSTGGNAISLAATEITYDPDAFANDPVPVIGPAARSAGKQLTYRVLKPGILIMDVAGLNKNAISDGIIATLTLTPALDLNQTGTSLTQRPSAVSSDSKGLSMEGNALALGQATVDGSLPTGTIAINQPTYRWDAIEGATWYQLYVSDSTKANRVDAWYRASEADCDRGIGTCTIKPTTALTNGQVSWWVRGWNGARGPWSAQHGFNVNAGAISAMIPKLYRVSDARAGQASALWAQVSNTGSSALPSNAQVWYYVSSYGLNSPLIGSKSVASLGAGATDWYNLNWTIPTTLRPGTYSYWARVYQGSTPLSGWSPAQSFTVGAATSNARDKTRGVNATKPDDVIESASIELPPAALIRD